MSFKRILGALVILLLLVAGLYYFYPPLLYSWEKYLYLYPRTAVLLVVSRHPLCSFSLTAKGLWNYGRHEAIHERILKDIRMVQNDPAGFHLWQTPQGPLWVPGGSDHLVPYLLTEQERQVYGQGEQGVRRGDIVLDCGAHVGVFTRVALRAGARLVVAIEPAAENLACLRRNLAGEIAAGRVIVYEKGVWDHDDVLTLSVLSYNSAADTFAVRVKDTPGIQLPVTTIDKLVEELKLERVDFIKMDIEGSERHALAGARQTLAKYRPRMAIAAYHLPDDVEKIPAAARGGWDGYRIECGPCREDNGRIVPEILYFR